MMRKMRIEVRLVFLGYIAAVLLQCCEASEVVQAEIESDGSIVNNSHGSFCVDNHENCKLWADQDPSECDENPVWMKENCRKSCNACERANNTTTQGSDCTDDYEKCKYWADLDPSECDENPVWMKRYCRKSCKVCEPTGEEDESIDLPSIEEDLEFDLGEPQLMRGPRAYEIRHIVEEAIEYMRKEVFIDQKYEKVKDNCKNYHEKCAQWALTGECESNPGYMSRHCAPLCKTCDQLEYSARCPMGDNLGPDAFLPGDVDKMFERIVSSDEFQKYSPQILSRPQEKNRNWLGLLANIFKKNKRDLEATGQGNYTIGPWVVTLEDFISDEECDRLIELGAAEGYERSIEVGKMKFDGTTERKVSDSRTSANSWCRDSCYTDPVAVIVMQRIENLTGVPERNSEYLQLLKYEEGEFYKNHHDYIPHHVDRQCGVRMITVFLYLNDVEEGGGTRFTDLNLTVYPKRGRALVWPSVLNEDPNQKDFRTHHQALPVEKGHKFGANAWVHQRDFKTPNSENCM